MRVHNILEETVISRVHVLYAEAQEIQADWLTCACEQCKLDTVAYVLNKLPAKYVVSGRGMAHTVADTQQQLTVDVDSLIVEGMKKIATTTRSYHAQKSEETTLTPVFNFPTFNGIVREGSSFEPVRDAIITLKFNSELAEMIDHTWSNPYILNKYTKGVYSFWVKPLYKKIEDETKPFHFTIEVKSEGYEDTIYAFNLPLTSDMQKKNTLDIVSSIHVQDLYLFHPNEEDFA